MAEEDLYIKKRRKEAKRLSLKFLIMRIFPIKKNKIVFSTFEGDGGFCCNPRYIAEEFYKRHPNFEFVWLTKNINRQFPDYIKVIKYSPWRLAYHLSTAKVWVDNYRKPFGTLKRKNQIYIQTWHASLGFKAVGLYRGNLFPEIARIVSEWDSSLADYFISNSDYCDRVFPRKLLYNGPTLHTGSPRVDCLINCKNELRKEMRNFYNLSQDTNIVLFAPTFRGGNQKGKKQVITDAPSIDFDQLLATLKNKFNGDWIIFLRLHPQLSAKMQNMPLKKIDTRIIDVSQASDISQIMGGCDLVITDYSSCAFDACFADIPVLLYADDVQSYIENRGKFMWSKEELPFLMAQTNDELMNNIAAFDLKKYLEAVKLFKDTNGICENGNASELVVDKIMDLISRKV